MMKLYRVTLCLILLAAMMGGCSGINFVQDEAFIPVQGEPFNPPLDLEIERTWTMMAYGESIGMIRGTTNVDNVEGKLFVKQRFSGIVGVREGVSLHSDETVWIGPEGMEIFKGIFQESGSPDISTMAAKLDDGILSFDLKMKQGDSVYTEDFIKDFDYHWSTAYINVSRLGFKKDEKFKRKILDIYDLKSKVITGEFMGIESIQQGGHQLECHKIRFDYGHIKGIMWLARDELSWFLVKEEAKSDGVAFQMYLDEYTKRKKGSYQPKETSQTADFGF